MIAIIIIRYGELTTKSKNRITFIKQLQNNVQFSLKEFTNVKIVSYHDRMEVINFTFATGNEIINNLTKVFGISSLSVAFKIKKDINVLSDSILQLIKKENLAKQQTFKLFVKRADKNFALNSKQITNIIAPIIIKNSNLKVDVTNPALKINIKINHHDIYLYTNKIIAAGGLPVGISGKVLLLLSGGIDSPVAAYKLMKRGLEVQYLHFTTPPFTNIQSLDKVKQLVVELAPYNNGKKKLFICNFTNLQNELTHLKKANYRIIIMRRMFIRIANILAKKLTIEALATGEAVGQVASQTLASINNINSVFNLAILRPLIAEDKVDIINLAQKIGTYAISILPFADCCSLFVPKKPIINPKIEETESLEEELTQLVDWQQVLINTFNNISEFN